ARTADEPRAGSQCFDGEFAARFGTALGTGPNNSVGFGVGLLGGTQRTAVNERAPAVEHLHVPEVVVVAGFVEEQRLARRRQGKRELAVGIAVTADEIRPVAAPANEQVRSAVGTRP